MESVPTAAPPTLLVVDDVPENLQLMAELLRPDYRVRVASHGEKALEVARTEPQPDLILLDIMMPELSGHAVLARLRENPQTRNIPVIFLTALGDVENETLGLNLGAQDYLAKPVVPAILRARVRNQIQLKKAADILRDHEAALEREVAVRTAEISALQEVTILAMASLAETRDNETGNHIRRTQHYVRLLARHLQHHPRFAAELDEQSIELLFKSAPLHDIGKIGIPDHILLKPGKLTPEEFEIMKTHTTLGRDAILSAERMLGKALEFLRLAKEIAYGHQEKWDGSGYPTGASGEAIPLSARLMAVADVYDALISRRPYKQPFTHEQALEIMSAGCGKHFDPDIFAAFLQLREEFRRIATELVDNDAELNRKATLMKPYTSVTA